MTAVDRLLSRARGVAFLIALGAIAFASGELAARVDDRIRLGVPIFHTPDYETDLTLTDSMGRRGKPNGRFKRWRLNSFGFRSPEVTVTPRSGCTRIMVLGASESFGLYESDGREFPAQLQDSLAGRGCYEVVNAALAGLGIRGITALWNAWASRFRPGVVLIYPTPMFYLSDREPQYPAMHGVVQPPPAPPWWTSRLVDRARDVFEYPDFIQERRVMHAVVAIDRSHPADWFWPDIPERRVQLFAQDLDSLVTTIQASGSEPVLITHAIRFGPEPGIRDSAMLRAWHAGTPRAKPNTLLAFENAAARTVRELGARRHLLVVDAAARMNGHGSWFADGAHFTDAGASVMARLIADALLSRQEATNSLNHNPVSRPLMVGASSHKAVSRARLGAKP